MNYHLITACVLTLLAPTLALTADAKQQDFAERIKGSWVPQNAPERLVTRLVVSRDDSGWTLDVWALRGLKEEVIHRAPLHLLRSGVGGKGPVTRALAVWKEDRRPESATLYATLRAADDQVFLDLTKVYPEPKYADWFVSYVLSRDNR